MSASGGATAMILMNDFRRLWDDVHQDVHAAVEQVGSSGWYILGAEVRGFEQALAERWGIAHAVGVASGLDAIEIGLRALGCRPGDRVLTTPLSAFATTLAIVKLGAVPVFADTDDFGLIRLDACERIFSADPGIRFFVPVHLYGHALDPAALRRLRDRFDLRIVEDCAQSIDARHDGLVTGAIGKVAATSFYPTKNLGAIGDGGALLTADPELQDEARALRDYGQSAKYRHDRIGYNSRLDELHAAILTRAFLPRLSNWTSRRRDVATQYLAGIHNPLVRLLGVPPGSQSCWHLFPVLVDAATKPRFMEFLRAHGVACGEHYPIPIHRQQALSSVPSECPAPLTNTERICACEVSLPLHPYLTDEEVRTVIDVCNQWVG